VKLDKLVADIATLPDELRVEASELGTASPGWADVKIADLAYDSRRVGPATLFCCVPGLHHDGHEFAAQAVKDGTAALLVERWLGLNVPEVIVPSVRAAMGPLAARCNGEPTRTLRVVGVTGTNGKTTSTYLVRALLEAAGVQTGLLGTVKSVIGGREQPVQRTTPEAIDLQADFRTMLDGGDGACAMEVSSHALAMGRTNAIEWAGALFTNLTQDHLDFHSNMEDYYLAKRRLFLPDPALENASPDARAPGVSVVNVGDPYGHRLAREIGESGESSVTFAVESAGDEDDFDPDYRATNLSCDASGCRFRLHTPAAGECDVELPMPGRFNVANAVGALALVHALGYGLDTLVAAIEHGARVPGRFERVGPGPGTRINPIAREAPTVIVDYAHTPDSLENVLRAAREIAEGRVVCVFGAGGDRDRGKRPLMGEIAARLADVAIVTSDNPRSEPPEAIVAEIVAGMPTDEEPTAVEVHVEVDRRKAIAWAIEQAARQDMVVIAGKGHEQGQELAGGVKVPFDDKVVAEESLLGDERGRAAAGVAG
jgi:UDP-N-acetylmuramoyl-L-alanyl-D-glutamate--2,6-diaminopimelate ligase